jgi:hypothetical protein
MEPHQRFAQIQYDMHCLRTELSKLRSELKAYNVNDMIEFLGKQPGDLLPITNNYVVTHELIQRTPNLTRLNLMNYLLRFWRDCHPDLPDEEVLQMAQKQFDVMMEYQVPTAQHRFRVTKVDDIEKYKLYRVNHQHKRLNKGVIPIKPPTTKKSRRKLLIEHHAH